MKKIYLDNAATTPPDKDILARAVAETEECYYNPSALYGGGLRAKKALDIARQTILKRFPGKKLIFTSCGTEADDTAVFSFAKRGNVVTTSGEHSAVFKCFEALKQKGFDVRYAKLKYGGGVDEDDLLSKIDENTSFISVVHVNNETGAINDINTLAKKAKEKNPRVIFHSDGVQAFGKIAADVKNVDLYSASAHKINGLKGTGCLLYGSELHFSPYIYGGGQEEGLRSGTENMLGISVFAACAEKHFSFILKNAENVSKLKYAFIDGLDKELFRIISREDSSPYIVSFSAIGLRGEVMQTLLDGDGVIVGTGSACSSRSPHSRILSAFERDKKVLDGALRVSFSPSSTMEEVVFAAKKLNEHAAKLKNKIY